MTTTKLKQAPTPADLQISTHHAFMLGVKAMLPKKSKPHLGCKDPSKFTGVVCEQRAYFQVTGGIMQRVCDAYLERYRAVMKERQRVSKLLGADGTYGWTFGINGFVFNLKPFDESTVPKDKKGYVDYYKKRNMEYKWYHEQAEELMSRFEPGTWKMLKKDSTPCQSHSTRKRGDGWGVLLRPGNKGPGKVLEDVLKRLSIARPSDYFSDLLEGGGDFITADDQCGCRGPGIRMLIPSFEVINEDDKVYLLTLPVVSGKEHDAAVAYGNVKRLPLSGVWKLKERYQKSGKDDED